MGEVVVQSAERQCGICRQCVGDLSRESPKDELWVTLDRVGRPDDSLCASGRRLALGDAVEGQGPVVNVGMVITGVALLALSVVNRGFGKPAWWFPPVKPHMDKVALVVMPLFGLLAVLAGFFPAERDSTNPVVGVAAVVLLLTLVVGAFIKVPNWVKPKWLRHEKAAREAAIQERLRRRGGR